MILKIMRVIAKTFIKTLVLTVLIIILLGTFTIVVPRIGDVLFDIRLMKSIKSNTTGVIPIKNLTNFKWDKACIYYPYTYEDNWAFGPSDEDYILEFKQKNSKIKLLSLITTHVAQGQSKYDICGCFNDTAKFIIHNKIIGLTN